MNGIFLLHKRRGLPIGIIEQGHFCGQLYMIRL